jgi:hypothetical protein
MDKLTEFVLEDMIKDLYLRGKKSQKDLPLKDVYETIKDMIYSKLIGKEV